MIIIDIDREDERFTISININYIFSDTSISLNFSRVYSRKNKMADKDRLPRWYPWSLRWFLTDGKPRTRDFKEKTRKSLRTIVTGRKFRRKLCPNSVNSVEDDVEIDKSTTKNPREDALIFSLFLNSINANFFYHFLIVKIAKNNLRNLYNFLI